MSMLTLPSWTILETEPMQVSGNWLSIKKHIYIMSVYTETSALALIDTDLE